MPLQCVVKPASDKLRTQCLLLPVHDGKLTATGQAVDSRLDKALTTALRTGDLAGRAGATLLVHAKGAIARIVLVSMGDAAQVSQKQYCDALRAGLRALCATKAGEGSSCLHEVPVQSRDAHWKLGQTVLLARELTYRFDGYRSKKKEDDGGTALAELVLLADAGAATKTHVARMSDVADGVDFAKDLGNTPGNVCQPTWLAAQAQAMARRLKLKCEVFDEKKLASLKMGSFLAVAKGSEQPPRMIVVHYAGAGARQAPIVLVGKGITFDTGGISIKPAADMDEMKFDMCGAASVLGTIQAIAQMKLPLNVVAVVAAAENMPSGRATRPGDIVTSMSGQTVEILNTDAEGRLVLCDALTYVERFKPAAVVDVATLTGACVIALGHHHAGLFSSDDALAGSLVQAGNDIGDTCWRMPVDDAYQEGLKSPFADVANVGGRAGGAITAACFLARFTKAYPWAHLDIAGVAWKSGANKGATGRPVGLLARYLIEQAG
ncbi:MAG: leucyl aminopeptidase [Lautropia sp.]